MSSPRVHRYPRLHWCILSIALWLVSQAPMAAGIDFEPEVIAGVTMQLPRGWHRQQDEYGLILTEHPGDDDSPVLALIGVHGANTTSVTTSGVADQVLSQLDLPAQGIVAALVEERTQNGALYRLHQLQEGRKRGYLASFTYVTPANGTIAHLFLSALEHRFVEIGGPMLPLVVFAGLPPQALARPGATTITAPGATMSGHSQGNTTGRSDPSALALASRISAMSHEIGMRILYNSDNGWCYRGESDCE